jgi:hypothetical protein
LLKDQWLCSVSHCLETSIGSVVLADRGNVVDVQAGFVALAFGVFLLDCENKCEEGRGRTRVDI